MCLLLWGVSLVGSGLNKAFGTQLRKFVSNSTSSPLKAFFSGSIVAVLLQSSMATCVMVSSFASRNIIALPAAIAVMIGADLGTTLAVQVMSLDLKWLMPIMISVGYAVSKSMKKTMYKNLGGFFVGIGLVLLALAHITSIAGHLKSSEALHLVIASLHAQPILAVAFSALFTWMVHSSLGTVLFYTSLVGSGVLPLNIGLYMVLGANMGGTIAPVIITANETPSAKRIPLANLFIKFVAVFVTLPFMHNFILPFVSEFDLTDSRMMVNFHTMFNLAVAGAFLPLVPYISRFFSNIIPEPRKGEDQTRPRHLDPMSLSNPAAALACASREVLRICEIIQEMFDDTIVVLKNNDYKMLRHICDLENVVDILYLDTKEYLSRINRKNMTDEDIFKYMQILKFATNLEYIGDVIDKSLMNIARKKINAQDNFSRQGFAEISTLHGNVKNNIMIAQNLLMTADLKMAKELIDRKISLRASEHVGMENHLKRLSKGVVETVATSNIHMDVVRDYMRINSHASAIAYDVVSFYDKKNNIEVDDK